MMRFVGLSLVGLAAAQTAPCTVEGSWKGDDLKPSELGDLGVSIPDGLKVGGPKHFGFVDADVDQNAAEELCDGGCDDLGDLCVGWYLHAGKKEDDWHCHLMQEGTELTAKDDGKDDPVRNCVNAPITLTQAPTTPGATDPPTVPTGDIPTGAPTIPAGSKPCDGKWKGNDLKPKELEEQGLSVPTGLKPGGPAHFTFVDDIEDEAAAIQLCAGGCNSLGDACDGWYLFNKNADSSDSSDSSDSGPGKPDKPGKPGKPDKPGKDKKADWHCHLMEAIDEPKKDGKEDAVRSCSNVPIVPNTPAPTIPQIVRTDAPTTEDLSTPAPTVPSINPPCTAEGKWKGDDLKPKELEGLGLSIPSGLVEGGPAHFSFANDVTDEAEAEGLCANGCKSLDVCSGWYLFKAGGPKGGKGKKKKKGKKPGDSSDSSEDKPVDWHCHFMQAGTDLVAKDQGKDDAVRSCANAEISTPIPTAASTSPIPSAAPTLAPTSAPTDESEKTDESEDTTEESEDTSFTTFSLNCAANDDDKACKDCSGKFDKKKNVCNPPKSVKSIKCHKIKSEEACEAAMCDVHFHSPKKKGKKGKKKGKKGAEDEETEDDEVEEVFKRCHGKSQLQDKDE